MTTTLTGTIARQNFGPGVWSLVTTTGQTYELRKVPQELKQDGLKVTLQGEIQQGAVSLAMIGPIFAIQQFELL